MIQVWGSPLHVLHMSMQVTFMEAVVEPSFRALAALAPQTAALALENIEKVRPGWAA